MIALVASVVLPTLFIGTGVFGLAVLAGTWRTYGGAFRRLQRDLAACDDAQLLMVTMMRHDVRVMGSAPRVAPMVRRPAPRQPARATVNSGRLPALPAAA